MLKKILSQTPVVIDEDDIEVEGAFSKSAKEFPVGEKNKCTFKLVEINRWGKQGGSIPKRGICLIGEIYTGKGKKRTSVETISADFCLDPNPHEEYETGAQAQKVYTKILTNVKNFIIAENKFPAVGDKCGAYTLNASLC